MAVSTVTFPELLVATGPDVGAEHRVLSDDVAAFEHDLMGGLCRGDHDGAAEQKAEPGKCAELSRVSKLWSLLRAMQT
jgi:hypothetical protein